MPEAVKYGARHSREDYDMLSAILKQANEIARLATALGAQVEDLQQVEAQEEAAESTLVDAPTEVLKMSYLKSLGRRFDDDFLRDVAAVKRVGSDDIRGYAVMWGDEGTVDLEREFFTRATNFWDAALGLPRPLTWDHGQDGAMRAPTVVGQIVEMGDDDIGRWYHATLSRSHEYRRAIDALIGKRALGTSSDSAPQYVRRHKTKSGAVWLAEWPLFAAALTATPCEPRMMDAGSPYWKSIAIDISARTGAAPEGAHDEMLKRWFDVLSVLR